jgi:glutathione S-transferase
MKLLDGGRAPNPRRVRVFLAEKGISIPTEQVDLGKLEHKSPEFTAINPIQRIPVLILDDGTAIAESLAICRYFEALRPEPALFGRSALEVAMVEMWQRRIEMHLLSAVATVFRHLHPAMAQMEQPQIAEWGEVNKPRVMEFLPLLDEQLRDRVFVAGEHYSVADITAMVSIDFMKVAKLSAPPELTNLHRWYAQVSERPSAKA